MTGRDTPADGSRSVSYPAAGADQPRSGKAGLAGRVASRRPGCVRDPRPGTLESLAAHLSPALAPPATVAEARRVAEALPAALTRELYLECRLGPGEAPVDLVAHVDERGRGLLAGAGAAEALPEGAAAHPAWQGVRALSADWANPFSPLHRAVSGVWLEFDTGGLHSFGAVPIPGVFVSLAWLAGRGAGEVFAVGRRALGLLAAPGVDAGELERVRCSIVALPAGAHLAYVGVFPERERSGVRLCARGLTVDEVAPWLTAAEWPGDAAAVAARVAELAVLAPPAIVHVDVGAAAPRVGVELALARRPQLGGHIAEEALLGRLIELGLCLPERAEGLGLWPGYSIQPMPRGPGRALVVRRVNHVKLAWTVDGAVEAKAYLCAYQRPRPAARPGDGRAEESMEETAQAAPTAEALLADADELTDDELEQVAGGLERIWIGPDVEVHPLP